MAEILLCLAVIAAWLLVPGAISLLIANPQRLTREGYAAAIGIAAWIVLAIWWQPIHIGFAQHLTPPFTLVLTAVAVIYIGLFALGLERRAEGTVPSSISPALLSDGLLAPIDEELLFRGIVLGVLLRTFPTLVAAAISAALFLLVHELARIGGVRRSLRESLADLFFGLLTALLYLGLGSILLPMLLHVLINSYSAYTRPADLDGSA